MYLVLSAFTSSPISFVATTRDPVFLYRTHASSQYINIISINQKLICTIYFKPFFFTYTLLKACSKPKLNSNGDIASPSFKPSLIGTMSVKFLPNRTPLCVSVRHIFIALPVPWGYQFQLEYYKGLYPELNQKLVPN